MVGSSWCNSDVTGVERGFQCRNGGGSRVEGVWYLFTVLVRTLPEKVSGSVYSKEPFVEGIPLRGVLTSF